MLLPMSTIFHHMKCFGKARIAIKRNVPVSGTHWCTTVTRHQICFHLNQHNLLPMSTTFHHLKYVGKARIAIKQNVPVGGAHWSATVTRHYFFFH